MSRNNDPLHIIKTGTTHEGDTREEYMKRLHKWCADATEHNLKTMALWQSYYMQFQQSSAAPNGVQNPPFTVPNTGDPIPANRDGFYNYTIPPMWKRFIAEVIDFVILFAVKMFLTILLIENVELLDFENYSLSSFEEQLQNPAIATKLTLNIFILEIVHRIIVCLYEAYWIALEGATPGKKTMRLAVVHAVTILQPNIEVDQVLAHPCTRLSFKDALFRAVLKNFFVGMLFPICFILLFFRFNRTGYDLLTNSLVVEHQLNVPQ